METVNPPSVSELKRDKNIVQAGDYVIIQRKNHLKLHRVTSKNKVTIGQDSILLNEIIGKPFWTTFKMESVKGREFALTQCTDLEEISEQFIKDSGEDNRNILDDGSSQMLSKAEIIDLRDSGLSSSEILGQLVENSKTFMNKTEFSQKKYLKKKERKYFDYITIRKPTVRLVISILYNQDPSKVLGLRLDTLSRLSTAVNLHSDGMYILYESGCQGIAAATMLNNISDGGNLIYVHPDFTPNKNAISAMNFDNEQMERLLSVNIHSLLRKLWQEEHITKSTSNSVVVEGDIVSSTEILKSEAKETLCSVTKVEEDEVKVKSRRLEQDEIAEVPVLEKSGMKRKMTDGDNEMEVADKKLRLERGGDPKKPQWEVRTEKVANLLKTKRADGLVIVAREHPTNIIDTLLPYLGLSKPFIVYCPYREVLQELYVHLKSKHSVADLWLTDTWILNQQVLPERTHPEVMMPGGGGYLLTGILVEG